MKRIAFTMLPCMLLACGVFTPHVAVQVNGRLDTSGTVTVTYDLASLTAWFITQCAAELDLAPTSPQVSTCATQGVESFLSAFGSAPSGG